MGLRIKANYTQKELEADIEKQLQRLYNVTLQQFIRLGSQFVTEAREKKPDDEYRKALSQLSWSHSAARAILGPESPGFNDQTGALRSSIGFLIFYNGKEVHSDFKGDNAEGKTRGREFARSIGADNQDGWALITVAGMEYAGWVEALGYDVITGSTMNAEAKFQKAWDNITKAFKK